VVDPGYFQKRTQLVLILDGEKKVRRFALYKFVDKIEFFPLKQKGASWCVSVRLSASWCVWVRLGAYDDDNGVESNLS
jgi:hypothetical protein